MVIILTNKYLQYLRPGDNLLYCPIKSEEVENMIDLKDRSVLCATKTEVDAILKEAEKQEIKWRHGVLATTYNPFIESPIVLYFDDDGISWSGCSTDLATNLLNTDKEMIALEFLEKYIDMTQDCSSIDCEKCKDILCDGNPHKWCNSLYWDKSNIKQVYDIVKSGNKEDQYAPERNAINDLKKYLSDGKEPMYRNIRLAIKALEERLNEKQK